jgi:hypothetical protein
VTLNGKVKLIQCYVVKFKEWSACKKNQLKKSSGHRVRFVKMILEATKIAVISSYLLCAVVLQYSMATKNWMLLLQKKSSLATMHGRGWYRDGR